MRAWLLSTSLVAILAVPLLLPVRASTTSQGQAQPRPQAEPRRGAEPERAAEPERRSVPSARAEPRPPEQGRRGSPPPRTLPPPRVIPPRYHVLPRVYFFPPISLQRGYDYHPYFGFYQGPYYGPFYPYPGPSFGLTAYSAAAVRLRVKPVETHVYVNGYYAGVADDFDGLFQRLYLPAGEHEIELYLAGHRGEHFRLYLGRSDTREITHQMQPLPAGAADVPPPTPQALRGEWTASVPAPVGDRPASPYGILTIRVDPVDAQILVDGEPWVASDRQDALVIHLPAGWHKLEVRRDGYQTSRTEIELSEGGTTRLNVRLVQ